ALPICRNRSIVCVPQSVVYHMGGGTLPTTSYRKVYLNFRNNLLMLYKNLPEKDLRPILTVRFFLDYIAAFQFLLKGQFSFAKAVWQARSAYKKMRPLYQEIRSENLRQTILKDVPERRTYSILWRYLWRKKMV
ncbi:MAG: glycosyltransferase family 2 protein, partial [Bacteroidaceae bacterium]|nr:glycosyltransferase family 2 protein [Bacteroidaceae bacterium]